MKGAVLIAFVALTFASCARKGEDELWLVPKGHTGWLVIIPDQPDGVPKHYENGRLVLQFPPSGVLKTRFPLNTGGFSRLLHTIDEKGSRGPLIDNPTGDNLDRMQEGAPYLFFGFTGRREPVPYLLFFAAVVKEKGRESRLAMKDVGDFLLEFHRDEKRPAGD